MITTPSFKRSLVFHLALVILVFVSIKNPISKEQTQTISVELTQQPILKPLVSRSVHSKAFTHLDLRPSFMKEGSLFFAPPTNDSANFHRHSEISEYTRQLLFTESKVLVAFDRLAEKINQEVDYPNLLVENGVQGTASLDLYFDHEGIIDEAKSIFGGSNRSVRGILAHAAREGILAWYRSDAFRLRKDQFKDQHFHADFSLSYVQQDESKLVKDEMGSYTITRKRYISECANPMGLDLTCVAIKGYGAIGNLVSSKYTLEFHELKAKLDQYDELGLNGIDQLIRSQS
jgi:hypothetical protein